MSLISVRRRFVRPGWLIPEEFIFIGHKDGKDWYKHIATGEISFIDQDYFL